MSEPAKTTLYGPGLRTAKKRRPGSLVLRVTAGQALRTLGMLFWTNVLLIVLLAAVYLFEMESTAARVGVLSVEEALAQQTALAPYVSVTHEKASGVYWQLPAGVEPYTVTPAATLRGVRMDYDEDFYYRSGWNSCPSYIVAVPAAEGGYLRIRFDLGERALFFTKSFVILVLIELLMWVSSIFKTRRSVRWALAPIQQLTAAARSISTEAPPTVQRREPAKAQRQKQVEKRKEQQQKAGEKHRRRESRQQELALGDAINTLNTITAKKLDTRIAIEDERRELQGLAGAINSMLDRLDAAYSSQLRFVSDASHELRTPIAVIQGYANLLDRWGKEDPQALQESIDAIKAEAEGMKVLVEQLLFLARSDNNSIVMQMDTLDAAEIAEDLLRGTKLIDTAHEFSSDIQGPLWVQGDAGLIKQALRIFMDNAIKYTPAGESIKVIAKSDGNTVRVSISDNGIGIPDKDLPHVFERFFRSDESRARGTGGTGLGLSIAKWTVQRHGGHMEILSRQDIGTRLTMALPQAEAPAPAGDDGSEFAAG